MPNPPNPNPSESQKESLFNRLILTPLTFLSFILSLTLISNQNTFSRTQTSTQSPSYIKSLLFKPPEPYAYITKPVEGNKRPGIERGKSGIRDSGNGNGETWYWHNNQRRLFRMEVESALELRRWVVVGLVVGLGVVGWGVWRLVWMG